MAATGPEVRLANPPPREPPSLASARRLLAQAPPRSGGPEVVLKKILIYFIGFPTETVIFALSMFELPRQERITT